MKRNSFTLTELLVVITIIAILAGLIMPAIQSAVSQAKKTDCMNNLKQISIGLNLYVDQNDQRMPYCTMSPSAPNPDEAWMPSIRDTIFSFVQSAEVFLCPEDPDEKYFKTEGLSYEWNSTFINGRKLNEKVGNAVAAHTLAVMYDYHNFHGDADDDYAKNFLFIDGRVAPTTGKVAE
jgi:prepilin-type N-terminal cleavage/methylation domain-containing protein